AGAMTTDELGEGVDDDVATMLNRPNQGRAGCGVIQHQWYAMLVCDVGDGLDIKGSQIRVADCLAVDRTGFIGDGSGNCFRVRIDELYLYAEPGEDILKE